MSSLPVSNLVGLQISKYTNIGSFAILIFDYCITFQDEVQWTWFRPWDFTRITFTISRYLPFVGTGMIAYSVLLVSGPSPPSVAVQNIIHTIGIVASEVLLFLRVWAFWQQNRRLLIVLQSWALVTGIGSITVIFSRKRLIPVAGGASTPGYFEATGNGTLEYTFLAAYEIVILILIAYKWFRDYKDFQSSIIKTVYRDGMFYVLCIIAITIANIVVGASFPIAYSNIFDTLQLVIHSVLASRILFRLRISNEQVYEMPTVLLVESNIRYLQPSYVGTTGTGSEV